ncbi:MAG TPA: hypothetical protein PKN61_03985 [Acidobacteriota bacterium]|nr:hypothetical protein [Acidobacteriota bacterium]HNR38172.1 hypothetical protein [Acidobacteriota bacterium]HNT99804.1 hypothetical protein [Acidobacteriota bacterium]
MNLTRLMTGAMLVLALGTLATADGPNTQQTPAKGTKPRTYNDESLKQYRGKGNITTSAQPQAAKAAGKPGTATPDEMFIADLGTEGQAIRNAYYAARKDNQRGNDELAKLSVRWTDLHSKLGSARTARERTRLRKEVNAVQTEMAEATQTVNRADQRMQEALEKADKAKILRPPPAGVKVEKAASAPVDPGR